MRKNADVWRKWSVGGGLGLHSIQVGTKTRRSTRASRSIPARCMYPWGSLGKLFGRAYRDYTYTSCHALHVNPAHNVLRCCSRCHREVCDWLDFGNGYVVSRMVGGYGARLCVYLK